VKTVAGLEAHEVRGASDELVFAQNRPSSLVSAGGRERTTGLFIEDIIRITPRLFITAGLRVDRWRNFAAQTSTRSVRQNAPAVVGVFTDRTETAFSPHLSALYKTREGASLFASVYRAFRQPTLNELYRSFRAGDVLTLANEKLRAERLTGGEAGTSIAAFNNRVALRATFFWSEINRPIANLTLSVSPNLITRQRQNLGRTRARGLEFDAEIRLGTRWALTGGYMLTDSTVISFPSNTALEGLRIPQVPRHQLTFQMGYARSSRFVAEIQGSVGGAQFDDDLNSLRLDRYFTLDAFASRKIGTGIDVFVAAENLLNQHYDIGRTPVRTLGPPRLLRCGIRFRFGMR
jgi:iron complex outermembrane recepter protein